MIDAASFWAVYLPFIIGIPMQTGTAVVDFGNWTSVTFQAICNFIAPFLIYIYISRRNLSKNF